MGPFFKSGSAKHSEHSDLSAKHSELDFPISCSQPFENAYVDFCRFGPKKCQKSGVFKSPVNSTKFFHSFSFWKNLFFSSFFHLFPSSANFYFFSQLFDQTFVARLNSWKKLIFSSFFWSKNGQKINFEGYYVDLIDFRPFSR